MTILIECCNSETRPLCLYSFPRQRWLLWLSVAEEVNTIKPPARLVFSSFFSSLYVLVSRCLNPGLLPVARFRQAGIF